MDHDPSKGATARLRSAPAYTTVDATHFDSWRSLVEGSPAGTAALLVSERYLQGEEFGPPRSDSLPCPRALCLS